MPPEDDSKPLFTWVERKVTKREFWIGVLAFVAILLIAFLGSAPTLLGR